MILEDTRHLSHHKAYAKSVNHTRLLMMAMWDSGKPQSLKESQGSEIRYHETLTGQQWNYTRIMLSMWIGKPAKPSDLNMVLDPRYLRNREVAYTDLLCQHCFTAIGDLHYTVLME